MSINSIPHKSPRKTLLFFLSVIVILVLIVSAVYILPNLGKVRVNSAKQLAIKLAESIPPPSGATAIKNWDGGNYSSWECYSGYTYLLYGSNLELTEVTEYYSNYFQQQGWSATPLLKGLDMADIDGKAVDVNESTLHVTGSGDADNYRIEVIPCTQYSACNGFSTRNSFPSSPEDKQILQAAQSQYKTAFLIFVVNNLNSFVHCKPDGG